MLVKEYWTCIIGLVMAWHRIKKVLYGTLNCAAQKNKNTLKKRYFARMLNLYNAIY